MDLDLPPLKEDDITLTFYSPAFVSAVLKDNDGDIVMQDLDDPSVTSRIVEVVEGTRTGVFQAQPEDVVFPLPPYCYTTDTELQTPQDLSYRVESVVEWVLVVDTNFILSHLYLVNNLVEAYHRWGNVVMIPWATIMELDGLKKSTSSIDSGTGVTVGMLARRANNWCFEKMAKREPGLWGQTKEEVLDSTAIKGDAAILDCCR
jgi:hypothetical protein